MIGKDKRIRWISVLAYGILVALMILEVYIIITIGGWLLRL